MAAMSTQRLTGQQIADAGLDGWTFLGTHLATRLRTGDFATGLALLDEIGAAAEEANHHPDLDLRYGHLDVRLTSHDSGGVTERDLRLARRVSALAEEHGVRPDSAAISRIDLALDTPDRGRVLPFWSAALGMQGGGHVPEDEIRDPAGAHPTLWFQDSGDEEPRQRWHLDVWVPSAKPAGMHAATATVMTSVVTSSRPCSGVFSAQRSATSTSTAAHTASSSASSLPAGRELKASTPSIHHPLLADGQSTSLSADSAPDPPDLTHRTRDRETGPVLIAADALPDLPTKDDKKKWNFMSLWLCKSIPLLKMIHRLFIIKYLF